VEKVGKGGSRKGKEGAHVSNWRGPKEKKKKKRQTHVELVGARGGGPEKIKRKKGKRTTT